MTTEPEVYYLDAELLLRLFALLEYLNSIINMTSASSPQGVRWGFLLSEGNQHEPCNC